MKNKLNLHQHHWERFLRHLDQPVIWSGRAPRSWASLVADAVTVTALPVNSQNRAQVHAFCRAECNSDEACFLLVMAWGGMRTDHARRAWLARERWQPIIAALRNGRLSGREQSYNALLQAAIPGVGVAYFTKLLHFLACGKFCYILDQWTARSVNLLLASEQPLVSLQSNYLEGRKLRKWVTDRNPARVYGQYCALIDEMAQQLDLTGADVEQRLFAGRHHPWRGYVIDMDC